MHGHSTAYYCANVLAVFECEEQELKAQYLCISTNRNADL